MVKVMVRGLDFVEIVDELRPIVENMIATDGNGDRVLTSDALDTILERCDDPDHAREPLAQAVYDFVVAHDAKIVIPRG